MTIELTVLDEFEETTVSKSSIMVSLQNSSLTQEIVDDIEPGILLHPCLKSGMLNCYCGQAQAGKSALAQSLAMDVKRKFPNYDICYFQMDESNDRVKKQFERSEGLYHLIAPSLGNELDEESIFRRLMDLADLKESLDDTLFIIDGMHNLIEANDSNEVRRFLDTCISLRSLGATVLVIMHALKYNGEDGFPNFYGLNTIRNKADNLLMLKGTYDDFRLEHNVETKLMKNRGGLPSVTVTIKSDNTCEISANVNQSVEESINNAHIERWEIIADLQNEFPDGLPKTRVIQDSSSEKFGRKKIGAALEMGIGRHFSLTQTKNNNAQLIRLLPDSSLNESRPQKPGFETSERGG